MAGKAGLKAGAIGVAIMVTLTLINHLLPVAENIALSLAICGVSVVAYAGIGLLAGFFLARPRTPGQGAGAGVIAGLLSGVVVGVVGYAMIATGVSSIMDSPQMQQAMEQGFDPMTSIIFGAVCNPILGGSVAVIGGAVLAGIKPD